MDEYEVITIESCKGCVKVVIIIIHHIFRLPIYSYILLAHSDERSSSLSPVARGDKFSPSISFVEIQQRMPLLWYTISFKNILGSARTHTVFISNVANLAAFCVRWVVGNWFSTQFITHNFEVDYNGFLYFFLCICFVFLAIVFGVNCKVHRHARTLRKERKIYMDISVWKRKTALCANLVSETSGDQRKAYVSIHSYWTPIHAVLFRLFKIVTDEKQTKNLAVCLHFLLRYYSVLSSSVPSFSLVLFVYIIYL